MTSIRQPEFSVPLDAAAIRLRALEIVTRAWGDRINTAGALEVAKEYADWIGFGLDGRPVDEVDAPWRP